VPCPARDRRARFRHRLFNCAFNYSVFYDTLKTMESHSGKKLPVKLLQELLRKYFDHYYFGTRKALNKELVERLLRNKNFGQWVKRLTVRFPKLTPDEDIIVRSVVRDDAEYNWCESAFLNSLPKQERNNFYNGIQNLLDEYRLPENFRDWLWHYVLYNKKPNWTPSYNFGMLWQVVENPKRAQQTGLTSAEKKFVKATARFLLGIKNKRGRAPKKYKIMLKKLNEVLSKSKNIMRRSHSWQSTLHLLSRKQKRIRYTDERGERIDRKTKYKDIATELYPPPPDDIDLKLYDERRAQNLRKRVARFFEREAKLLNKKLKK
jgi:hypothetical protein